MDLIEINQKLNKILDYQEKQQKYAKIKFWVNLAIVFVFIILPLILLPFVVSQVFNMYSNIGAGNLESVTEQATGILNFFQEWIEFKI